MKKLLISSLLLVFCFSISYSQLTTYKNNKDTLSAAETIYFTFPSTGSVDKPFDWQYHCYAKKVSGTPYAKVEIEIQAIGSTTWIPIITDTIRISGDSTRVPLTGTLLGGKIRAKTTANSGTQVSVLSQDFMRSAPK